MTRFIYICTLCAVLVSCKSDTSGPGTPGNPTHTTIDTRGRKGFSFAQATVVTIPNSQNIWPDFEARFGVGELGPRDFRAYFIATQPNDSLRLAFHFVAWPSTQDSARGVFQSMSGISDTTDRSVTGDPFLAANQIWTVKTRDNRFGKLLIIANDISQDSTYATATFDWSY